MISFEPTEDQRLLQHMFEGIARDALQPAARELDRAGSVSPDLIRQLEATGLVELALAGEDATDARLSAAMALEEIGYTDAAFALTLAAPLGYVRAIMTLGTEAQRARLQADWANGSKRYAAVIVQEPGFGFDVAALKTTATRQSDGFQLVGSKSCVPRGHDCSEFLVVADAGVFIVPASLPGIRIEPCAGTLGLKSLGLRDIHFDGVSLPATARLGGSDGCDTQVLIDSARVATAAILTGVCRAVLDHLVPYLKQRVAHGSALAQKQSVAFRLADMSIDIPSMRWMTWRAATLLDKKRPATREARLTQIHCAEQALWITDEGVQLMGGHGYLRDNPVERWYRDARTLVALEGVTGL